MVQGFVHLDELYVHFVWQNGLFCFGEELLLGMRNILKIHSEQFTCWDDILLVAFSVCCERRIDSFVSGAKQSPAGAGTLRERCNNYLLQGGGWVISSRRVETPLIWNLNIIIWYHLITSCENFYFKIVFLKGSTPKTKHESRIHRPGEDTTEFLRFRRRDVLPVITLQEIKGPWSRCVGRSWPTFWLVACWISICAMGSISSHYFHIIGDGINSSTQ